MGFASWFYLWRIIVVIVGKSYIWVVVVKLQLQGKQKAWRIIVVMVGKSYIRVVVVKLQIQGKQKNSKS